MAVHTLILCFLIGSVFSEVTINTENFDYGNKTPIKARTKHPNEVAEFLANHNSSRPVAVLVDDTSGAHADAAMFMSQLFELHYFSIDMNFLLMEFNSSDATGVLQTTKNNFEDFRDLLEYNSPSRYIGCENPKEPTLVFFSILMAVPVLEDYSTILIFIDRDVNEEYAAAARQASGIKHIKIYAYWGNLEPGDTQLLKDVVRSSGGKFYVKHETHIMSSESRLLFMNSCIVYRNASVLFSLENLTQETNFDFPVYSNTTGIYITVSPPHMEGTITTPLGKIVNISHSTEVAAFSPGSYTIDEPHLRNIQLNTTKPTGIWTLKLRPNRGFYKVTGVVLSSEVALPSTRTVPQKGFELEKLKYINYDSRRNYPTQPITVEVGLGSELITTGGTPQIFFEVTNLGNNPVDARFYVTDLQYILWTMYPLRKILAPRETTIVRLTLRTKPGTYQDDITFTVSTGVGSVQKKLIVDVGTSVTLINDIKEPELDYYFTSDCTSVMFSKCEHGTWSIEVWAKDTGSGLLQITSNPTGLYFPYGFIIGTREQVTGYYSDSCCNPDLRVTLLDRSNNRRQWHLNAYWTLWGAGMIAALVLGILLVIIIICLIVWWVIRYKKQKGKYELPRYKGGKI